MKILVISDLYPPYYIGGYELNCRDAVDSLISKGHAVTVLTSSWGQNRRSITGNVHRLLDFDSAFLNNDHQGRYERINIFLQKFIKFRRLLISNNNYRVTRDQINTFKPDIVFLWHLNNLTVSPALAAQDAGIPMCFRIEDYSLAQIKDKVCGTASLSRRVYRDLVFGKRDLDRLSVNNLIFISQYVKNYYLNAGFPEAGTDIISSGVFSCELISPSQRQSVPFSGQEGIIRLVFTGRVELEKGPDLAILAVANLKRESPDRLVHLDIIGYGDSEFLDRLKKLARDNGVEDRIAFLGKLDQQEIQKRFQLYDALLFTSRWPEPFGRVLIEAMSQGLPIIAAQTGGVSEIVTDSEDGLLVLPDDSEDLAKAVGKLMHTPGLAARLSHNAFSTVRSRFTMEHIASRMEEYLMEIVKAERIYA